MVNICNAHHNIGALLEDDRNTVANFAPLRFATNVAQRRALIVVRGKR
jgi:hypothetical protein